GRARQAEARLARIAHRIAPPDNRGEPSDKARPVDRMYGAVILDLPLREPAGNPDRRPGAGAFSLLRVTLKSSCLPAHLAILMLRLRRSRQCRPYSAPAMRARISPRWKIPRRRA